MAIPAEQREVAAFLSSLAGTAPLETHISAVFRGAETVWKLKKAVRLSFLDFSGLDARRHFTQREFALNAPAAPGLYRDVAAVVRTPDVGLALTPTPEPGADILDWVLRMGRVPDEDFLDRIAASGDLTPALLDELGDVVAGYHQTLPPAPISDQLASDPLAAMRRVVDGNAEAALSAGLPTGRVGAWQTEVKRQLDACAPWLRDRAARGLVRRGHGDLHLGNLCRWQGRVVPFDALEFDESLATIDLGYDLAFLLMDLEHRASRAAANRVMNRYIARTGDAGLTRFLPAFLSCRALIKAHVAARSNGTGQAFSYLDAAEAYLRPAAAQVLAVGGLPGTGKSTLARTLAPEMGRAPGAAVLRSDEIRKRLHDVPPEQKLPLSAYTEDVSAQVIQTIAAQLRDAASGGQAVVADATFLDPAQRQLITEAARAAGVPFTGIWLVAPLAVLEQRIAARVGDASDATIAVLHAARHRARCPEDWVAVDATDRISAAQRIREIMRIATGPC